MVCGRPKNDSAGLQQNREGTKKTIIHLLWPTEGEEKEGERKVPAGDDEEIGRAHV